MSRSGSSASAPRSTTASIPRQALAATVRYLQLAEQHFGRADLAVVSYHMGIGNLQQVLDDYDGGHPVPYTQLYFDTRPDHHAAAYDLLPGFGDDSSLYYWRVLGAVQIMHLYRTDRRAPWPGRRRSTRRRHERGRAPPAGLRRGSSRTRTRCTTPTTRARSVRLPV